MSQMQYNSLMSDMLKQRQNLALLRAQLEKRTGRNCWKCGKFGHLACNCRSKEKEKEKRRATPTK